VSFRSDLGESKTEIFFKKGLDGPNHVESVQQNSVLPHADFVAPMEPTGRRKAPADDADIAELALLTRSTLLPLALGSVGRPLAEALAYFYVRIVLRGSDALGSNEMARVKRAPLRPSSGIPATPQGVTRSDRAAHG
jgi:hypothetical protein